MDLAPYGFCHDVFKLLPQLKLQDPEDFPGDLAAAARVLIPKFKRLDIEIQLDSQIWRCRYSNKDEDNESCTWEEITKQDPDYVFFYRIKLTYWPISGFEVSEEYFVTKIMPFVCGHVDNIDGHLKVVQSGFEKMPENVWDILKQESRIKSFDLTPKMDIGPFIHHKIDTVSPLKLILDTQAKMDVMQKLEAKVSTGDLVYLDIMRTDMSISLEFALKIIRYFKETLGEKKFYLKAKKHFPYKQLKAHLQGMRRETRTSNVQNPRVVFKTQYVQMRSHTFTLPVTNCKLCIQDYEWPADVIVFQVS
ncbi:hypothetical protein L596_021493 [Steinernema carpocapsae]|uniref:Uncharacterized protein n=1 Tax=Steinernema carpocapsae TaxID=34508 RepID=A0A4U5MIY4_STECR|nr:hypothetical protein L596_021493 [Steinernema carpocapsae]